jgi:hypothetical protein
MPSLADFWWVLTWACIIWFSTVTIYVAVRGAFDIKGMLARLARDAADEDESPD